MFEILSSFLGASCVKTWGALRNTAEQRRRSACIAGNTTMSNQNAIRRTNHQFASHVRYERRSVLRAVRIVPVLKSCERDRFLGSTMDSETKRRKNRNTPCRRRRNALRALSYRMKLVRARSRHPNRRGRTGRHSV